VTAVTEPTVVLVVVTSDLGVLITKRKDGSPPYGFPAGEVAANQQFYADAADGIVLREAGIPIEVTGEILPQRPEPHPVTGRRVVYMGATADSTHDVENAGHEDLEEVRWATVEEAVSLMPDMYGPVRNWLGWGE
jgi:8-oxo-dGTP diphosphatase